MARYQQLLMAFPDQPGFFPTNSTTEFITANTAANPTVVTSAAHGLASGDSIIVASSNSTPSLNGTQIVTVIDANRFSVPVNVSVAGTEGTFVTTASQNTLTHNDAYNFANALTDRVDGQAGGAKAGYITVQQVNNDAVKAFGTLTVTGGVAGDTVVVAGTTFTAVDDRDTTNVTFTADTSGSLNSKFFNFQDQPGTHKYYVWFNINGAGVDPAPAGRTGFMVAGATNASAATLATAAVAAVGATPIGVTFTAGASGHIITKNVAVGAATATADGSAATSFTFTHTITGATPGLGQYEVYATDTLTAADLARAINAYPAVAQYLSATSALTVVTLTALYPGVTGNLVSLTSPPSGGLNLATAGTYAALAASALTGSSSASTLTGNIGISPNNASSITNFPPSTFTGVQNAANAAALQAQNDALAAYNAGKAMAATAISSTLDGQTLTPGVYKESSGTFNLAASGGGTLTFNGAGVYIFQCSSTLVTGAGGTPTMTLSSGATAGNIYWLCGSSATLNSGHAGTFQGNVIAQASVTDTSGGTINGSLIALTGAVTYSAATTSSIAPAGSSGHVMPSGPFLSMGANDTMPVNPFTYHYGY